MKSNGYSEQWKQEISLQKIFSSFQILTQISTINTTLSFERNKL